MAKYKVIACYVLWREICRYASMSRHLFDFTFLRQGLHNTPDILRESLQSEIDRSEGYDAILIGYGLCSNGIEGVRSNGTPLVVIKGHDCITVFLGSRRRYREYFDAHPGTYWYTPGWIETTLMPDRERAEAKYKEYAEKYGGENAEYLMEAEQGWMAQYNNAAYVDYGDFDSAFFRNYARQCADRLKWDFDELTGDPRLIRDFLSGEWDDRFAIAMPGSAFCATHDEDVIGVRN